MEEKIEEKIEPKCDYPECRADSNGTYNLKITNEENSNVDLPLCNYHKSIVMGGRFTAAVIRNSGEEVEFRVEGPLLEVEIAEQVIGAVKIAEANRDEKK